MTAPSTPLQRRPSSPHRNPNDVALRKVIEEKTKIEGEMLSLRTQIRTIRTEKEAVEEDVSRSYCLDRG